MRPKSKVPDYNPDKEGWHKHKWIVTKATQSPDFNAVDVGDKHMPFDKEGRFAITDEGVANAIRQEHRWDVAVTRFKSDDPADRGHKYVFTVPEMPWKRGSNGKAKGEEKEERHNGPDDRYDGHAQRDAILSSEETHQEARR